MSNVSQLGPCNEIDSTIVKSPAGISYEDLQESAYEDRLFGLTGIKAPVCEWWASLLRFCSKAVNTADTHYVGKAFTS